MERPSVSVTVPVTVRPRSSTDLFDGFLPALDAVIAPWQCAAMGSKERVTDFHENILQRRRHAVKAPFPRGVGCLLCTDSEAAGIPRGFSKTDDGTDPRPSIGFPSLSTMMPPTDHPASTSAVKIAGTGSR